MPNDVPEDNFGKKTAGAKVVDYSERITIPNSQQSMRCLGKAG